MHLTHLSLSDFRSYAGLELDLGPGVTSFVGRNGQGKTNIVEAVDYLSSLSSHRAGSDAPLVRVGAEHAVVRAAVVREDRKALMEVQITPGRSNTARVNRSPLPRARDLLGLVRTVVFTPDDLALVKGDPSERRRFLDDLLVQRSPRYAGTRADYDRVLRQRNSLLKSHRATRGSGGGGGAALETLGVWDAHLSRLGGEVLAARTTLVEELNPLLGKAYEAVARGGTRDGANDARLAYRASCDAPVGLGADAHAFTEALLAALEERRADELDRGVTLAGPHRDDLVCTLSSTSGELPLRGYASHGESWSFALALRLASYQLLRNPVDGAVDDPILVLDDVFAELDEDRRGQLAELVADAEQVLVTVAVAADVPEQLQGTRFLVADGTLTRE
ncbi:MAG: DNA replication/repair protein RecF [Marmoricola sp.]